MAKFNKVIELQDEITQTRDGEKFHHKKVYEDNDLLIYKVNNNWYELFRKKIVSKKTYQNGEYKIVDGVGRVRYPKDNDFGSWAWNCVDIESINKVISEKFPNHPLLDCIP